MSEEYGLGISTSMPFELAVVRTRLALRAKGFSILSEMQAPPSPGEFHGRSHLFMGVWERLTATGNLGGQGLDVGDHLACNVVVFEEDGTTSVAVLDPAEGLEGWGSSELAEAAHAALEQVLQEIGRPEEA